MVDPLSLLGSVEDYNAMAADPVKVAIPPTPPPQSKSPGKRQPRFRRALVGLPARSGHPDQAAASRQERQLANWNRAADTWRKQEARLAKATGTEPARLGMNEHRNHLTRTLEKDLLDRTREAATTHTHPSGLKSDHPELWARLDKFDDQADNERGAPAVTYQHLRDSRAGPEFWQQPELLSKSGLPVAVRHQRAVFEYVSRPNAIRRDLSEEPTSSLEHDTSVMAHIPEYSDGLLPSVFNEVNAWVPDCSNLCVVGRAAGRGGTGRTRPKPKMEAPVTEWDRDGLFEDTIEEADEGAEDGSVPSGGDAEAPLIVGPALVCRSGSEVGGLDSMSCRAVFNAMVGEIATSTVELVNKGTTVIHYSWVRVHKLDSLGIRKDKIERFTHDRRRGVLLPGERTVVRFQFISESAGIYTEPWELSTVPLLQPSPSITLCATCNREDVNASKRRAVEAGLERRMISHFVQSVLYDLIHQVQPVPRPATPPENWLTLGDRFRTANAELPEVVFPGGSYDERVIQQGRALFALAWRQKWTQDNHPAPPKPIGEPEPAPAKSAKGKKAPRESTAPTGDSNASKIAVPSPPEWNLKLRELKAVSCPGEAQPCYYFMLVVPRCVASTLCFVHDQRLEAAYCMC